MTRPTDDELLTRHADGDPEAFRELFSRYEDRLWAVAVHTCGDPEVAAAAVHAAVLTAYRRIASARDLRGLHSVRSLGGLGRVGTGSSAATWLQQLVVDACLDRLRDRPAGALPRTGGVGGRSAATDVAEVADVVNAADVEGAFAALPDQQRSALALVDLSGLALRDAATILRVPEATVSSRLRRGRDALLTLLRPLQGT